jgi:putative spermidine/putrescine transport system permease protein
MGALAADPEAEGRGPGRRAPRSWRSAAGAAFLLMPPLAWLVLVYLAALVALFVSAFWTVDDFTGELDRSWTLQNFAVLLGDPVYRRIALRTIGMAALVSVTDIVLAFPMA